MDPVKKASSNADVRDSDADITFLLYKLGKSFKNLIVAIGRGFAKMGTGILLILLFLLRNIIWIIIGAALGLGYGIYKVSKAGPEYTSEMVLRANFNSSRSLYNTIDYLNSVTSAGDTGQLSKLFGISSQEAGRLVSFAIKPVRSEIIVSEIYYDQFMRLDRTSRVRVDTFWTRTIKYEDFKESLTDFDFPYYTITVTAAHSSVFPKLQNGIIQHVSNNELLQELKKRQAVSNQDEEKLIVTAIQNLDTLRRAYNQRITKEPTPGIPGGSQLTVMETSPEIRTPELDLYDKMLELQDELKKARKRSVAEKDIIEVYSPFSPSGKKGSFFNSVSRFLLIGFLGAIIILVLIALYKFLVAFEASRKFGKTAVKTQTS